jgi:hypothetical protein
MSIRKEEFARLAMAIQDFSSLELLQVIGGSVNKPTARAEAAKVLFDNFDKKSQERFTQHEIFIR